MLCSETSQHCLQSNNLDLTLALSSICSIVEEIRAEGKVYVMCRHVKRPQRGCILIMKTRKIHLQHSFCLSIQVYITEEEMASRTQVPLLLSSLWYGLLNLSIQYIGQHLDLSKKKKKREREREPSTGQEPEWSWYRIGWSSSAGKESGHNVGNLGLIPGLGRSPEEGKGYPLQYSGLENSMDYTVHGVAKSWTQLSSFHFHFFPPKIFRF